MGLYLYTVEKFSPTRRVTVADFSRLQPAVTAARACMDSPDVNLAVVRNYDGSLAFAVDRRREWHQDEEEVAG